MAIYDGPWQGGVHHSEQIHGRSKGGKLEDAIKDHGRKGLRFFSVIFMILDILSVVFLYYMCLDVSYSLKNKCM